MNNKEAFFKDMATALDVWVKTISNVLSDSNEDLIWTENEDSFKKIQSILIDNCANTKDIENVINECLKSFSHSFLTILDGGTTISDDGRKIFLVDEKNNLLCDDLHYEFTNYLIDKES